MMSNNKPPEIPIDWAVVQEIHAIYNQGGRLDTAEIIAKGGGAIIIRREYKMPDGTSRTMKNTYDINDTELNADLFMLEVGK